MARQDVSGCTVGELQELAPCVKCLSKKELLALLVVILAVFSNYDLPDDMNQLLEDSSCFACQSDRERFNGFMSKLVDVYREDFTVEEIREEIKCLVCVDETRIKSALALLLCNFFNLPA